jgi:hypothetical protein
MFYEFMQNNSGGMFDFYENQGITQHVIVEAASSDEANDRAEDIGLYFDGCYNNMDCSCCGDRWYRQWTDEGYDEPKVFGTPVADYTARYTWNEFPEDKTVSVHYLDGRVEWY